MHIASVHIAIAAALAVSFSTIGCTAPTPAEKSVFMTRQSYTGNLVAEAGDPTLDGPASADLLCNQSAAVGGLTGTYTAWLSSATLDISAIARIQSEGPWRSVDTTDQGSLLVWASRADLAVGNVQNPITYDLGNDSVQPGQVTTEAAWTGTHNNATPSDFDCQGWSGPGGGTGSGSDGTIGSGTAGMFPYDASWGENWSEMTNDGYGDPPPPAPLCTDRLHLYCFED